jgi:crotonobetainyl-CoA:carnitine CoA-transferase CaiB-like acyl-CoA transferase
VLLTGLLAAVHKQRKNQTGSIIETSLLAIGTYSIGDELLRQKMKLTPASIRPADNYYQCSDGQWLRLGSRTSDSPFNEDVKTISKESLPYWLEFYRKKGIPAMGIPNMTEVLADRLVQQNDILDSIDVPPIGAIGTVRAPYRFLDWKVRPFTRGPNLGEHNELLEN